MGERTARFVPALQAQRVIWCEGTEREGGWVLSPQDAGGMFGRGGLFVDEDDVALGCNAATDAAKSEAERKCGFFLVRQGEAAAVVGAYRIGTGRGDDTRARVGEIGVRIQLVLSTCNLARAVGGETGGIHNRRACASSAPTLQHDRVLAVQEAFVAACSASGAAVKDSE